MNPIDLAQHLKQQANDILQDLTLWRNMRARGTIHATGSYSLDCLVWPDLDLYYESHNPEKLLEDFAAAGQDLIPHPQVRRFKIEKGYHNLNPMMPKGLALGLIIEFAPETTWKIDIWALDKDYQQQKLNEISQFNEKMTPEIRTLILEVKHQLMGDNKRTPNLSSYYVYQAVLEQGLTDFATIKEYIQTQGLTL